MRISRVLVVPALVVTALSLTACIPFAIPAAPPAPPAPVPTVEPTVVPTPSTPVTSPAPQTSEPVDPAPPATGSFTITVDGTPIEEPWVATVTCQYSDGFGIVDVSDDGDFYFSMLLSGASPNVTGSLILLTSNNYNLWSFDEVPVTINGNQLEASFNMDDISAGTTRPVTVSGPCTSS